MGQGGGANGGVVQMGVVQMGVCKWGKGVVQKGSNSNAWGRGGGGAGTWAETNSLQILVGLFV